MAMSGVSVQDQCVKMWEKMKTSKIKVNFVNNNNFLNKLI